MCIGGPERSRALLALEPTIPIKRLAVFSDPRLRPRA